jgi:hypothetical protein
LVRHVHCNVFRFRIANNYIRQPSSGPTQEECLDQKWSSPSEGPVPCPWWCLCPNSRADVGSLADTKRPGFRESSKPIQFQVAATAKEERETDHHAFPNVGCHCFFFVYYTKLQCK